LSSISTLIILHISTSTLFPYTTLFRSKNTAYHDYRQLLIYYNALLEMLYSEELADDVLEAFDTQAPENIVENDENIIDNYNQFLDRKSTRLNSSHDSISYAVF